MANRGDAQAKVVINGVSPRIAVVVSTQGKRPRQVHSLLESLHGQTLAPSMCILADQSHTPHVSEAVTAWKARGLPVRRVPSTVGLSRGRNDALRQVSDVDFVVFIDDDCRLGPEALRLVAERLNQHHADVLTGRIESSLGARARFGPRVMHLNDQNVWSHAIEAAMAARFSCLQKVGNFDEGLGVGAPTPWQSGEGTDMLLRALRTGFKVVYDPAYVVYEGGQRPSPSELLVKTRKYARGTGRVYRRHYGPLACTALVLRPLGGAILLGVRGDLSGARRMTQAALGRLEGLRGRVLLR